MDRETLMSVLDYDPDSGLFTWRHRDKSFFKKSGNYYRWNREYAGKPALRIRSGGYFVGTVLGERLYAHRVAFMIQYGYVPDVIDHIDGNGLNNKIDNLKASSNYDNSRNCKLSSKNTSGYIGVSYIKDRSKWYASIGVGGKTISLGRFNCVTAAAVARKVAEQKYGFSQNHGRDK